MQKNALIVGAVIIVILAGILFFVRTPQTQAPTTPSPELAPPPASEVPPPLVPSVSPGQALPPVSVSKTATITITDAGFSPATITVTKGTTVTFKNEGSRKAWPASNPHPVHTEYPAAGGCIGSTFDACKGIPPGSSWSFIFAISGTWGYHDHLNPVHEGTVVVQ